MSALTARALVDAGLYDSEGAVIQDALRLLLREKPQVRIAMAVHRYQTEAISVAKAASLAGVSFDQMKDILVSRGVQPRLGSATLEEAREEVEAMRRITRAENDR
jgi:predicted HTH domain antitoxin